MVENKGLGTGRQNGFSIIELLLVIATIGLLFAVTAPNLTILSSTEAAQKINTLAGDIRAAYDMAILHRRPHRLVFHFATGEYWLETTDRQDFFLAAEGMERDLSPEELKEREEIFKEDFQLYVDLAGREVEDIENETVIPPISPLLAAKEQLQPPSWRRVEDSEWSRRTLGPYFVVQGMQAEHHMRKITLEEFGDRAFAYLYFFPRGYVERAVIYLAPSAGGRDIDESEPPYTITTEPFEGVAKVESGYREVDIFEDRPR
jgi:type II secretory pathway pseudopilin PulG